MKKIATLAVAGLLGLGLATAADAQQRPMGASGSSGSSMSQSSQSTAPAKSSTSATKSTAKKSSSSGASDVKAVQTALNKNGAALKCGQCKRVYPIKDDIPVMLIDEATIEQ